MKEKKYYWIKLKTNFFNREDIDFMLSQENGCQYVVLYQMLCLNTANNDGKLETKMNEMIVPYDIKKIVRDTKYFDYDTVAVALDLYKKLGLIYEEENKILRISNYNEMIGSETAWAEQKRIYREKQKTLLENVQDNVLDNVSQEYRDKSIDIRDKNNIKENKENKKKKENELFDKFWEVYPRKVDKKKAREKFTKIKPTEELVDLMIKQIERFKQTNDWQKENGKYIPHPSTWLNNNRWEDEIETEEEKEAKMLQRLKEKYGEE